VEAEQRRDEVDKERNKHTKLSSTSDKDKALVELTQKVSELDGEKGIEYTNMFATEDDQHARTAFLLLKYATPAGDPVYHKGEPLECLARIIAPDVPAFSGELMVIIYCPRCMVKLPPDHCLLQVRQSNRKWFLDVSSQGTMFVFNEMLPNGSKVPRPYFSAGVIVESEKFRCGRCNWRGVIDNNIVRSV
jgi:hypothetical protein